MDVLTFDVGLAYKLKRAFAKAGWTEEDIDALAESDKLMAFKEVLAGISIIDAVEHIIDCDKAPFNPWWKDGFQVLSHTQDGKITWNWRSQRFALCWVLDPHEASSTEGAKLIEGMKLKGQPVLNANVLDFLLKNQHLIPSEWEGKAVQFLGTIYSGPSGPSGAYRVRNLCGFKGSWHWRYAWLSASFSEEAPTAYYNYKK